MWDLLIILTSYLKIVINVFLRLIMFQVSYILNVILIFHRNLLNLDCYIYYVIFDGVSNDNQIV
jgi:hypothetical protein